MKATFVDTSGWIAIINSGDNFHAKAISEFQRLLNSGAKLITNSFVLTEVANALSLARRKHLVISLRRMIDSSERVEVVFVDSSLYGRGWVFYENRLDKDWSLTDCISFLVMQDLGLTQALTNDHHFEQAGFTILLQRS